MTSFNAVGAILPLDEYWKNCVHPKPLIPQRYPGAKFRFHQQTGNTQGGQNQQAGHRKVGQRQAGNVRSYKDEQDSEEDEDEQVGAGEPVEDLPDADSDLNSNVTQMNYELEDFNKTYCGESSPWQDDVPNPPQGRRPNTNNARPNVGQKTNVKSRLDLNNRWNKRHRNQNPRRNNGNTLHHSGVNQNQNRLNGQQQQQARFMLQQRMRFAYNSFRDNNMDQSPNVLMNQNPQFMGHSSNVTSMIDPVANLADSRTYNSAHICYETTVNPLNERSAERAQVNTLLHRPLNERAAERPQVNTLPQPGTSMGFNTSAMNDYTVQQVARHVMLMMSTVRDIDTQETPEYFKSKKSINAAGGESHIFDRPEGFN